MEEVSLLEKLWYWIYRHLDSDGKLYEVKSWQILQYLLELERRGYEYPRPKEQDRAA